jgi:hypothetical protein
MMRVRNWMWAGVVAAGVAGFSASAQGVGGGDAVVSGAAGATSVGGVLRGLASRAGVIFVGTVQSIVRKEGVVEITFLVEKSVLGVVGGTYIEREWAGRWVGGQERYRVGQRAMFFLHAPGSGGLSSSVDGMMGVVSLVPMGADGTSLLDVRLLATRVSRRMGEPMADAGFGAISLTDGVVVARNWQATEQPEPVRRVLPAGVVTASAAVGTFPPEQMNTMERTNGSGLPGDGGKSDAQR